MIKMSQKILFLQFQFLLVQYLRVQQYTRTTVITNNIDQGCPGSFNLIFANQFKWAPYNNTDPEDPSPFNLIFDDQFKWTPYNNI